MEIGVVANHKAAAPFSCRAPGWATRQVQCVADKQQIIKGPSGLSQAPPKSSPIQAALAGWIARKSVQLDPSEQKQDQEND
jgi:hypothetical protein